MEPCSLFSLHVEHIPDEHIKGYVEVNVDYTEIRCEIKTKDNIRGDFGVDDLGAVAIAVYVELHKLHLP